MPPEPLLEVQDIHGGYGSARVLHGVSFAVGRGETHALLGRNGMGKTTTVRSVLGLNPLRGGRVLFEGHDITRLSPEATVARGLAVECGTDADTGGILYRTTELFLERLGLTSLVELPDIAPLLPDVDLVDEMSDDPADFDVKIQPLGSESLV